MECLDAILVAEETKESQDLQCGICLEQTARTGRRFGLLEVRRSRCRGAWTRVTICRCCHLSRKISVVFVRGGA